MSALLPELPAHVTRGFGRDIVVGHHRLAGRELFSDAALIELLDRFPRRHLHVRSMGDDPLRGEQNLLVQHDDAGGAELLQAVRSGRLWLNVTRVDRADAPCRELIRDLYNELQAQLPGFVPDACQGTLLISSPHALVYYHADAPASVLWHVRGRKRVWVYPALDERYLARELLEDLFAGVRDEYMPYAAALDDGAQVFDLEPGQWIAWPQNAPHRITNLDSVNVSLVTEHHTPASRRRFRVYVANRFLRTRLGWPASSVREQGAGALAKTLLQRLARKFGLDPVALHHSAASLRLAPGAPGSVTPLQPAGAAATPATTATTSTTGTTAHAAAAAGVPA
jgi:hypothetical protein